jgi:hypothetical protein
MKREVVRSQNSEVRMSWMFVVPEFWLLNTVLAEPTKEFLQASQEK